MMKAASIFWISITSLDIGLYSDSFKSFRSKANSK